MKTEEQSTTPQTDVRPAAEGRHPPGPALTPQQIEDCRHRGEAAGRKMHAQLVASLKSKERYRGAEHWRSLEANNRTEGGYWERLAAAGKFYPQNEHLFKP